MKVYYVYWSITTEFGFEHGKDKFTNREEAESCAEDLRDDDYSVEIVEVEE